ncbi:ABC transporter substrate-binding protein [Oceanicola sp. 502str15]|uniref:ABC transporter substrate-binding protein n=1 Tax=Oceanicola sp. 502str15 TaxID=2696061 RepID=UPI0020948EE9|nr:ABC transporter substrate-binding protein [Oceanicola sp. 502str15]MCO6381758.1 ABC transporter substrate-binding protein [Oceanicola sp. 502str15]
MRELLIGAAMALAASGAWAQQQGVSDTEIVIGESDPLSGPAASVGLAHAIGTKLAVAEVNANGGIGGRTVRLIQEDDGYVPSRTVQTVRKLIDVDKVFAILNTSSSAGSLGVVDMIDEAPVVMMNTFVNNTNLWTPPRDNIFSIGQGYPQLAFQTVKYIDSQDPNAVWAIIVQNDDFGDNLVEGAERALEQLGKDSALTIRYNRGQKDFSAEMLRVKQAGATALFSGAISTENVSIAREAVKFGLDIDFGMMWTIHLDAVRDLMGAPAQDAVFAEYTSVLDESAAQPILKLADEFLSADERAAVNRTTLAAYAGAKVLFDAMAQCEAELTQACVIEKLEGAKDIETGAMAPTTFGPGVRFSDQKVRIIRNDFANTAFVPMTEFEAVDY